MSNSRKIQGEIDKLQKKIQEGLEVYEDMYDKTVNAPNQLQKERNEAELKKQIKKLQRYRDEIKTLLTNPEVKDKKSLEAARKQIESKMESFKSVERETKTKAYSKEGLATAAKSDPAEMAKQHTIGWLRDAISDIEEQIEKIEADILETDRKGKKGPDERVERVTTAKQHVIKLETMLRLVQNDDLLPNDADEVENEVQEYASEVPAGEDTLAVYDQFDLPDIIPATKSSMDFSDDDSDTPATAKPTPPSKPAVPTKEEPPAVATASGGGRVIEYKPATPAAAPVKKPEPKTPPTVPSKVPAKIVATMPAPAAAPAKKAVEPAPPVQPVTTPVKKAPTPSPAGKVLMPSPKIPPSPTRPAAPTGGSLEDDDDDALNDDTFGDDVTPSGAGSLADIASMSAQAAMKWGSPPAHNPPAPSTPNQWEKPPQVASPITAAPQQQPQSMAAMLRNSQPAAAAPAAPAASPQAPQQPPAVQTTPTAQKAPPPVSASPPQPTPGAPQQQHQAPAVAPVSAAPPATAAPSKAPLDRTPAQKMFEMSYRNLPATAEVERLKPYVPPNPSKTPAYYPQTVHPAFSSPEVFAKFDVDTLFFIFYYQQNSYQQYLAAKELKKQSWRYHKKFLTWFQRHDKPRNSTEESETGSYLYFDYESVGWCQRIKNEFVFSYKYLEDELV